MDKYFFSARSRACWVFNIKPQKAISSKAVAAKSIVVWFMAVSCCVDVGGNCTDY